MKSRLHTRVPEVLALLGICALLASCGDEAFSVDKRPAIEVDPSTVSFIVGNVSTGDVASQRITITNSGEHALTVAGIEINYSPPVGAEEPADDPSLKLVNLPAFPTEVQIKGQGNADRPDELVFDIEYKRHDSRGRTAQVTILSDDVDEKKYVVEVKVIEGQAVMLVIPDQVVFRNVHAGETPQKDVTITNTGNAVLQVAQMVLLGDDTCSLVLGDQHFGVNEMVEFDPPLDVGSQSSFPFKVQFAPRDELPTECKLIIFANSENAVDGYEVVVLGNNAGPCVEVSPQKVNFGAKLKGGTLSEMELDIRSCGEEALEIFAARLSESEDEGNAALADLGVLTSSPQFKLDFADVTADGEAPTDSEPLSIPVNDQATVKVHYTTPNSESLRDQSGAPIPDRGFIVLQTNAFQKYVIVEVTGFSVSVLCPTAVIEVAEGTNVIPQTTIHLDGSASFSPNGAIDDYAWTIEQPEGSVAVFLPNANFPTPQVELNVAGEYKICLTVRDTTGQESCEPACEVVTVTPDEAIHVELLWTTPGDPDEFDEGPRSGTDLDLHFIHPFAGGQDLDGDGEPDGYFSDPFDCFWFNPHPDWGTVDPNVDDNPGLDRDDTDGAGPENMNLNVPEDDVTYKVGVHYWQDPKSPDFPQGFGQVLGTVRIYIFGKKVWEKEGVQLVEKDMWEVATVHWPSQSIKPIFGNGPGGMKIIPNYENPFFIQ